MPASIRSRLLTLVLAWMIPALIAAAAMIWMTAQAERDAQERRLEDSVRAMSLVLDRELARRAAIASAMASSPLLDTLPNMSPDEAALFAARAREAMQGLPGWVEVSVTRRVVLDSRLQPGTPLAQADAPAALVDDLVVRPLANGGDGASPPHASVVVPVVRNGRTVANLAVTLVTAELQRMIDEQKLPRDWIAGIVDTGHQIIARHPAGQIPPGRLASPAVRDRLHQEQAGAVSWVSMAGVPVAGYFSTTPQGWSYVAAMPEARFGGFLQQAVVRVGLGALLLMLISVAGALWVSRRIAQPVVSLKQAAARMRAGQPVNIVSTGIVECDEVVAALAETAETLQNAHADLEQRVAEAVARTREAEQRLSHNQRVEALGRLTGGVAHDFNNLLGVVSNSARLVQRHAATMPSLQSPVAAILRSVESGSRLTQQLLRLAGRREVSSRSLDLARWLPEMEPLLRSVAGGRITIAIEVTTGTPAVTVDAGELELALVNLVLNARDAMPGGGKLTLGGRRATVEETAELPTGDYVALSVADNGLGMEGDLAVRVFEPFFTTKEFGQGAGLGLAQVRGFCTQAGGTAHVSSRTGEGTTVTLVLPADGPGAPVPAEATRRADALYGVRLMVVEDNEDLGATTAALLETHGATVERALSPDEALRKIDTAGAFDAVLTDVVMPGPMNGLELARALREDRPGLPVVLISGFSMALAGIHEFIVLRKPCTEDELVGALLEAVGGPVER